jgi:hypothetical protein
MPLLLDIAAPAPRLSTHDSLKLEVLLRNDTDAAVELPTPDDRTDALTFEVFDPDGRLVRRMNGFTHQKMMTRTRIDATRSVAQLPPHGHWSWTVDLASYHYPLPAGSYTVQAVLNHPPARVLLRSSARSVHVDPEPIGTLETLHENPVIDGLALLATTGSGGAHRYYLRQHNFSRPLAAWYSERILEAERIDLAPFVASPSYFRTETFDHFFLRWVLWGEAGRIHARRFVFGRPAPEHRAALLPPGEMLLRYAHHTADDRIFLFFRTADGRLVCYRLEDTALVPVFEHALDLPPGETGLSVRADEASLHLVYADGGLAYERLDHAGRLLDYRRLFRTRLRAHSWEHDLEQDVVRGLFRDSRRGRLLQMAVADLGYGTVESQTIRVPFRGEIREASFDRDAQGRFWLAVSTTRGRLYCLDGPDRAPLVVARGVGPFHPHVVAQRGRYLGYQDTAHGYRYVPLRRGRSAAANTPATAS